MSDKPSYLAAAFKARPFGMPVPPNWFVLAAFGLLGAFLDPAFWLIGAGVEGLYLWAVSSNPRFRNVVDAEQGYSANWNSRYQSLSGALDDKARATQSAIEQQAGEIVQLLSKSGAHESQIADVRQMAWLHLKLLAARASFSQVIASAVTESKSLDEQEQRIDARLARNDADEELRRSLEQQREVIKSRRAGHADATRRCELVDAELERLRQQFYLVREQALLATDEHSVAQSIDALSASLNEANRWLKDQTELFAGLDNLTDEPPPPELLDRKPQPKSARRVAE